MQFSYQNQQDFTLQTRDFTPNSITQSQIMNTLNSSIEDLLSKISKVQNDYEWNTFQQPANPQKFQGSILKENRISINQDEERSFKRKFAKNEEKQTDYSSQFSVKRMFQNLQNYEEGYYNDHIPAKTSTTPNIYYNLPLPNLNKAASFKIIRQQSENQQRSQKLYKIQSLFDHSSIKEVAQSQIITQNTEQGSYEKLEQKIRQKMAQSNIFTQKSQFYNLTLRQFQIGAEVGSGKFGEVYICRHKATGFIFALKKIFKSTITEYNMESQFCLELKILYMLNHPNIIKLYGHFCDEYHIFLLMEYIEGGQLLSRLKSNERYVSRTVQQVINAVEYIHDRGIVHRDIKPENIVIAFDNTAKLCDFGWAGIFDYKVMKTTFCGTLDYVSPEMKDKGQYTSKVDLWSLGVLTYEMLTGNAPFQDKINDWKKKGSKRSVPWDWHIEYPSEISTLAQSFMRNLLKQNPDERASLYFCKSHSFIRNYKEHQSQINIQIYI